MMGSPTTEPCRQSDEDHHQVTLTHSFEIQATLVTQAEFEALMGYNNSHFGPSGRGSVCGMSCPVENVNWHESAAYCNALSLKAGLTPCYTCSGSGASVSCVEASTYSAHQIYDCPGYRLPTDAEWEYAYRAGTNTAFYNGSNDPTKCTSCSDAKADAIAWYGCNAAGTTHPVQQKLPNDWGLYDMAGNVWELCHDGYQKYLGFSAVTDPVGASAKYRVGRGGAWPHFPSVLRAAHRFGVGPNFRSNRLGFRCARTLSP
jgi:formylglycine-generating enzyme required for sulfatase activity